MYLSIAVFFIGFAMAVGGVYFYQRSSETEYSKLRLGMNASQNDMARAVKRLDEMSEGIARSISTIGQLSSRMDALENRNPQVSVQLTPPSKPFLVEVIGHSQWPKPKHKDNRRATQ